MGLGLAVGGCASVSGPAADVVAAGPQAPERFAQAPAETPDNPGPAPSDWISQFNTADLAGVVAEALTANPDLIAATARAEASEARARGGLGRWLPDLDISLSGVRTGTPPPGGGDRIEVDSASSRLSASWEADVWGRVADGVRAGFAENRAAQADLNGARLSIAGQTARAWVDLTSAQQQLALAEEDLATRQRALDITERRYARGLTSSLALRTARSQTASARAQRAAQADATLGAARRLQSLMGRYPDGAMRVNTPLPVLTDIQAAGAPAEILRRRPDVLAAQARLESAGLRANQARKALLPRLTLQASGLGAGTGLADITDVDGLVTQLVAGLTLPLFQGGALRADATAARAEAKAAAANYVDATINAWREVEAALSADASLSLRETELAAAAAEAREAQALAEREYERGVATIFELIDSYSRRIDAERALIDARADRVSNRIAYHVALGGGADTGGLAPQDQAKD
jgi:NodT family efflux transporter outer membrane factor (OMF) lipoprotein